MNSTNKWLLTDEEKDKFIATLTPNLTILRTSAEISQEELANLIGVSRQTYSAIERKVRKMAWSTYLSLVLFYDHNRKTHKLIRQLSIFPKELVIRFNDGVDYSDFEISSFLGNKSEEIIEHLDDQAKGAIRAMVMMEYARCNSITNDASNVNSDVGSKLLVKCQEGVWMLETELLALFWGFVCKYSGFMIFTLYELFTETIYQHAGEASEPCAKLNALIQTVKNETPQQYREYLGYLNSPNSVEHLLLYLSGHNNPFTNSFYITWLLQSYTFNGGMSKGIVI